MASTARISPRLTWLIPVSGRQRVVRFRYRMVRFRYRVVRFQFVERTRP